MELASSIGDFQARVLLTFLYFSWLAPFGLLVRLSSDPSDLRGTARRRLTSGWTRRVSQGQTVRALRNQF